MINLLRKVMGEKDTKETEGGCCGPKVKDVQTSQVCGCSADNKETKVSCCSNNGKENK